MTRTITDYSFLDEQGAMVDVEDSRRRCRYFLQGKFADSWMWYTSRDSYRTSWVKEISEEGEVVTFDGEYMLQEISPDYKEFLHLSRRGVLTIANWNIHGTAERGYYLTGDIVPQKRALIAKIISQDGNLLIIRRLEDNEWQHVEKIFVFWNSMHGQVMADIIARGKLADIEYSDFEKFNGIRCKPVLKFKNP